jgi:hypothetical protein
VLTKEYQALKVENRKTEELNQKLQEENNLMMNRWKQKTSEEAHTMNAANDLYNQMLEANKRAQLLQKIEGTTRPLSADASPSRSYPPPLFRPLSLLSPALYRAFSPRFPLSSVSPSAQAGGGGPHSLRNN